MIHVVYHAGCSDGISAFVVLTDWLQDQGVKKEDIKGIPMSYPGVIPENIQPEDEVWFLDFCLKKADMQEINRICNKLTVVDHHATAWAQIGGLSYAKLSNTRCGATALWAYLYPEREIPFYLQLVEDFDLYRMDKPDRKELKAYINSYPLTVEKVKEWFSVFSHDYYYAISEGMVILRAEEKIVNNLTRYPTWVTIAGYRIPARNATVYGSAVANKLLELYPDALFSAYWEDKGGFRTWGLRSRSDFSCLGIAEGFGGGGHKQACGFRADMNNKDIVFG